LVKRDASEQLAHVVDGRDAHPNAPNLALGERVVWVEAKLRR